MSLKRLRERVPSAKFIVVATLSKHALRFHKIGKDGSAKCDAAETGNVEHSIIGVVYKIYQSEKPVLDQKEGLGYGYEEKVVSVTAFDGTSLKALTYYATNIDPLRKPFHWYKAHVIKGMEENGFPQHYTEAVAAIESIDDPDRERHYKEMSIYG